ncbi:MAG: glycosyltransferase family 2 protein [Candidatus Zhuqueibacterota bacterium]
MNARPANTGNRIDAASQPGLVSVIIPTFNSAALISQTLQSVLWQLHRPMELIIVDDGSTDATAEVVSEFEAQHAGDEGFEVHYFYQPNAGGARARNAGLILSRGEYIQFLDADDILSRTKIARQYERLKGLSGDVAAYGAWAYFEKSQRGYRIFKTYGERHAANQLIDWIGGWFVPTHSILWKRATIAALGPWDEQLRADQDGEYALRFLRAGGKFLFVDRSQAYYRQAQNLKKIASTVSRRATEESIQSRIGLAQRLEAHFIERNALDALARNALARRYFEIARHWTQSHPDIRRQCLAEFERLSDSHSITASFLSRTMYRVFGFTFTQKLKHLIRGRIGVPRQFRARAVPSLEHMCAL